MQLRSFTLIYALLLVFGSTTLFAYPDRTFTTDGTIQDGNSYYSVYVDASTVDMTGGLVDNRFELTNNSVVNFYGGLGDPSALVYDSSTFNVHGNTIEDRGVRGIFSYGTSNINVAGGIVNGSINAFESSVVNISDGIIGEVNTYDNGVSHISGGEIHFLSSWESGVVNVYGYGFEYIPDGSIYSGHDLFSGFWQDGTAFNINCYGGETYDNIVTHVVPEPATLLLLGIGAVMIRKKTKAANG